MWTTLKTTFVAASLGLLTASGALASPVPRGSSLAARDNNNSYVGYAFYYFIGNSPGQEEIYAAVSRDNTPTAWDLINSGSPILTSNVGTLGVRDPSIVRSSDGTKFYLIATDLNIGSGTSWGDASQRGSRSIVVWESGDDLKTWSEARLVQVIGEEAGSAWAPEALWNDKTGMYDVYFSAQLYDSKDTGHTASSYYRIMKASTTDFTSFTPAEVYVDRQGDSVLDMTFLKTNNGLYRFIKNENPTSDPHPLTVYQEKSDDGTVDGNWTKVTENIGAGVIGANEGPTAFVDIGDENKAWLWVDEYNDRGYVALNSENVGQGSWTFDSSAGEPSNHARHGTIIPLNQAQYDNLRAQV
ncbi:probable carbon source-regulated protein (putative arabinase) [Ustilago trichophora]|uniref:Probable carbon source-regulated protein (Putative arabinase) n=1 Tax=Ustilago trichophora TaxID=86804 RepID=A0A5C3EPJ5_9BASI|nr:probable carbon source-regulated protein (putative arabinase) [Ustilago trichophora]